MPSVAEEFCEQVDLAARITPFFSSGVGDVESHHGPYYLKKWGALEGHWWLWNGLATLPASQRSIHLTVFLGNHDDPGEQADDSYWLVVGYQVVAKRLVPGAGLDSDILIQGKVAGIRVALSSPIILPPHWVQIQVQEAYRLAQAALPIIDGKLVEMGLGAALV